jgi:hypothetical protein
MKPKQGNRFYKENVSVKRSSSPSQIAKAFYVTSAKGFAFRMLWGLELKIVICTAARNVVLMLCREGSRVRSLNVNVHKRLQS